jgi:hypothetical protein
VPRGLITAIGAAASAAAVAACFLHVEGEVAAALTAGVVKG